MSDKLKWRNRHAVLLREPTWAGIAARENYKIRADLMPMFEAHPASEDLLEALAAEGLHREGCEFLARNMHRRAAVWWGYCCLMTLFEERKAVAEGKIAETPDEMALMLKDALAKAGLSMPKMPKTPEELLNFEGGPEIDIEKMLAPPVLPPQDGAAIDAASSALGAKTAALERLIPPEVSEVWDNSHAKFEASFLKQSGLTPDAFYAAAQERAAASPLTYQIDRSNSPAVQRAIRLRQLLKEQRKATQDQIKAAFPEDFPKTPEAATLLKAEKDRVSDTAVQAVWRWIVAPDERNTTLALQAGNAAAGTPEGMLAYAAAWSFGDLTPEGKQVIPVPPELPGTGIVSALLMMALDQKGHRKMAERYELYFNLGLDVVHAKKLWPNAMAEDLSPHERVRTNNRSVAAIPEPPASSPASATAVPAKPYRKWKK